ncbi:putative transcriptional regulator [Schinkia azotoformans MEV2011]|uniref:Putative transcriptional regulator n=1 Tax=Schinkia azotoformans MEV2011 TaxID=1348973 RepID=A0A072NUB6_SCHAZ|nr:helix-turn-helix transcriptional regulator [Schinkia azotoformans]KEF40468.1 putative transcriptional regulator [Schinkia azotoformans MEV2011]MEC1696124.1 helix-turn-helix transcriptional regulator [Schinkia azotoformans]MEC1725373.1 helix-turn-helix transcriptional regulator [Schinkia azotoformans]MEC1779484.1 helix-turn-helix transcriptional regulator [Schinkia azotoformans]MED4330031.1 helix-turn-helix transcriptional regulator [Schinkia azotoformans]
MLAERIKKRRKEKKLTQEYMAEKLGITRQGYGHYETGRNEPDNQALLKIADILECSVNYLLGTSDNPTQTTSKSDDYNPLEEINKIIKDLGLEEGASGFFDIEKWKQFGPEDVEEIRRHFEWVAHKAKEKKYNPDENDTDGLE